MRVFAVLYTCVALFANAAAAEDWSEFEAMREGDMRKLVFAADPETVPDTPFVDEDGAQMTLADLRGRYALVNFWATWCAPCRAEMPSLAALQEELGGDTFQVVTIAADRNPPAAIRRFFEEIEVTGLPKYRDPTQALARRMAILGLPITVLVDPEGREIARLRGDADWASEEARSLLRALIERGGGEG